MRSPFEQLSLYFQSIIQYLPTILSTFGIGLIINSISEVTTPQDLFTLGAAFIALAAIIVLNVRIGEADDEDDISEEERQEEVNIMINELKELFIVFPQYRDAVNSLREYIQQDHIDAPDSLHQLVADFYESVNDVIYTSENMIAFPYREEIMNEEKVQELVTKVATWGGKRSQAESEFIRAGLNFNKVSIELLKSEDEILKRLAHKVQDNVPPELLSEFFRKELTNYMSTKDHTSGKA